MARFQQAQSSTTRRTRFLQVVEDYTWINPHLTLIMEWNCPSAEPEDYGDDDGEAEKVCQGEYASVSWTIAASNPAWRKWRPSDPTSPHWYDEARLARLMAAHIAHAEDHGRPCPTIREFISEFRGLSGTAKARAICEAIGAARMPLTEFYGDGTSCRVSALLSEMRNQSRPVKPRDLGPIGKEHLAAKFESLGVASETFDYRRAEIEHDGLPYLAEAAFGYCPNGASARRIITGINWSPAIGADPFRRLGPAGESLDTILTKQRAGRHEPIVTVLHLACPRIDYLDRGKSSIAIPGARAW